MRVAGIAVHVPPNGRPAAHLIVLDDAGGSPAIEVHEDFPSDDVEVAEQLHDQAEAIRSRLRGLRVDRVVIRRADRPPRASNREGPRRRLLAEGAIVSAARSVVIDTRLGTGKDTGEWHGSNKRGVDTASEQLLNANNMPSRFVEATSAALAALNL
jgi:hypothetical protein